MAELISNFSNVINSFTYTFNEIVIPKLTNFVRDYEEMQQKYKTKDQESREGQYYKTQIKLMEDQLSELQTKYENKVKEINELHKQLDAVNKQLDLYINYSKFSFIKRLFISIKNLFR